MLVIGVGIVIVVVHFAQGFAGNAHPVGQVIVADGNGQFARFKFALASETVRGMHGESAIGPCHALHAVVLAHVELVIGRHLAVVLQRLAARGLCVGAGEGNSADLQQLRGGEKRHVRGIVKDRIADAALVDQHHAKARLLRLDGASQPGRPCAHYQKIEDRILRRIYRLVVHASRLRQSEASMPLVGFVQSHCSLAGAWRKSWLN